MAATPKKGAVKKVATKKVVKKRAPVVRVARRETPKQLEKRVADKLAMLRVMYDLENELEDVKLAMAQNMLNEFVFSQYADVADSLAREVEEPVTGRLPKYQPEWMLQVTIALMAQGASKVELSATLGITRETLNQWTKQDTEYYKPIFSDTVKVATELSNGWWERIGRKNIGNKDFSYTGWYMNMKNRFGWKDKTEIAGDPDNPVRVESGAPGTDWKEVEARMKKVTQQD